MVGRCSSRCFREAEERKATHGRVKRFIRYNWVSLRKGERATRDKPVIAKAGLGFHSVQSGCASVGNRHVG
eukprot:4267210-Lingulodinium_polyedra.AAC.1